MSAATALFRANGDLWAGIPLELLHLESDLRSSAVEVMAVIASKHRAGELDERLTDARIAEALGRSESFVQKGLKTLTEGVQDAVKSIITRTRAHGRRTIELVRGLATRGTKADPPEPPGPDSKKTGDTTTDGQGKASSSSSPPPIGPDDPTVLRALGLIGEATPERVLAAASVYGADWLARALDQVERRNLTPGKAPVRSWIFVLRILEAWTKEGGPPAAPTAPKPPTRPAPTAPAPEPARRLADDELAALLAQCRDPHPIQSRFARVALRKAIEEGEVPAELLPTIPADLADPHRRE